MNPNPKPSPRDEEIDAFLRRNYRDTTPEFEKRWVDLKRQLRSEPAVRRPAPWLWWLGALTVGATAVALLVTAPRRSPPLTPDSGPSPALAELFAMDTVLSRGTALLDGENRDALLHLPTQPKLQN
ncbi:MAG: hypothetical protein HZA93_02065 [Verrucomicrobia bacterium]|nr:hypothetical protein [Verrucomicrobiota bacterium]